MSEKNRNLLRAAEILERVTPFSGRNCGSLCGAACCKGSDNDGMELFPGESELLAGEKGFKFVESQGEIRAGYSSVTEGATGASVRLYADFFRCSRWRSSMTER